MLLMVNRLRDMVLRAVFCTINSHTGLALEIESGGDHAFVEL